MNVPKLQLKTRCERISERLLRLGKKWKAEHLEFIEQERKREAEMKIKEIETLTSDKHKIKRNLTTTKKPSQQKDEMNLQNFLKNENDLMLDKLRPKDKQFKPFTKDLRLVDAKYDPG